MKSLSTTISRNVMLSLIAVLVIFLLMEYLVLQNVILPGFQSLQQENAVRNAETCRAAIKSEISHLAKITEDWSVWDDTYQFVMDGNQQYLNANMVEETFTSGLVDMIYICKPDGKVVFGTIYDPLKKKQIKLADFPADSLGKDNILLRHSHIKEDISGIVKTSCGPLMVSSHPIITSKGKGPARGSLIMGRFLHSQKIKQLSEQVNVDFSIAPDITPAADISHSIEKKGEKYTAFKIKNGPVRIDYKISCLDGGTATLSAFTPNDIMRKGISIAHLYLLFGLAISSACLLSVFLIIKFVLLRKIESICKFVKQITETGDLSVRAENSGNGELNALTETINNMLDTLEANEEQITQARIDAEEASETKNLFLANMSHEIRTPMNAIIGFSDLLADEPLPEHQKDYVDAIRNSSENLLNLINDILDFSKIEAGKLNIEMDKYSFKQVFTAVESPMYSLAVNKGLDFEINRQNDLPETIYTDIYRLQQCLVNLIGNAIKFTKEGHVFVNVTLEDWGGQPFIRFDVEDTGIGISEDKQKAIFESFTQEDISSTRVYGGTGLGLAITKQLASLLGGDISLSSQQGVGSVFSLTIPVGLTPANRFYHEIAEEQRKPKTDETEIYTGKYSGSILVAEDVKTNQVLIELLLKKMGFDVTIVEDGCLALEKTMQEQFDMIFMDIHMPNMNGYEATKQIRKNGIDTPIIALTANVMAGDRQKCINIGCSDFLPKPVDAVKLAKITTKYLSSKQLTNSN